MTFCVFFFYKHRLKEKDQKIMELENSVQGLTGQLANTQVQGLTEQLGNTQVIDRQRLLCVFSVLK
jgi:hypothetical protein